MAVAKQISFGPFSLDVGNQCLWQGTKAIPLRPKAFAVLKLLVDRAGQLVTKDQVLEAVWPGTFVSDAVLKDSIRQLREALNDDAGSPTYIETAHRRGYRFIASIAEISGAPPSLGTRSAPATGKGLHQIAAILSKAGSVLGRETELAKLEAYWDLSLRGNARLYS
jgi:DNA-binding winged helix-turn-helix (wHTH) protein